MNRRAPSAAEANRPAAHENGGRPRAHGFARRWRARAQEQASSSPRSIAPSLFVSCAGEPTRIIIAARPSPSMRNDAVRNTVYTSWAVRDAHSRRLHAPPAPHVPHEPRTTAHAVCALHASAACARHTARASRTCPPPTNRSRDPCARARMRSRAACAQRTPKPLGCRRRRWAPPTGRLLAAPPTWPQAVGYPPRQAKAGAARPSPGQRLQVQAPGLRAGRRP